MRAVIDDARGEALRTQLDRRRVQRFRPLDAARLEAANADTVFSARADKRRRRHELKRMARDHEPERNRARAGDRDVCPAHGTSTSVVIDRVCIGIDQCPS